MNGTYLRWFTRHLEKWKQCVNLENIMKLKFFTMNKEATKIVFWFEKLTSTQNNKSTFFIKLL